MWSCIHTWKKSSINTLWCLLGCSIGDFGVIIYFQSRVHSLSVLEVMSIAIIAGLITSIALETFILLKLMSFKIALKTAIGMSFISMLVMEVAMNTTDFMVNGAAVITLSTVPIILIIGFLAPLPYNYWRLKKFGFNCH